MDLTQKISGVTLTKSIQVSPDADAKKAGRKKTVILKVNYDGLTLEDVLLKALDKDVVSWQNGASGRDNYDNLVDKGTIKVNASTPGKAPQVDPKEAVAADLAACETPKEQKAFIDNLIKMAKAKTAKIDAILDDGIESIKVKSSIN